MEKPQPEALKISEVLKLPWKAQKAYYAAFPKPLPSRGAGVIRYITALLERANPARGGRPITKEDLLAKLAKKFPGRPEKKLRTTIDNNVPNQLNVYFGVGVVHHKDGGYYAESAFTLKDNGKSKSAVR